MPARLMLAQMALVAGAASAQGSAPTGVVLPPAHTASGSISELPAAPAPAAPRYTARRQPPRPIVIEDGPKRTLVVGDVKSIELPAVARIAIGNGALLKATVVDDRQIILLAEAPGETSMHVWLKDGRQITYQIEVNEYHADLQLEDVKQLLSDVPSVHARMVGDRVVLEGRYPDTETADRIKLMAKNFPTVLNLISEKPADIDPLQNERMIQLDLRVVEVKKRALDQLGIKWATSANGPSFTTNVLGYSNTPFRPPDNVGFPPVTTGHPIASYFGLATSITSALTFLEENGDAWTLAEPRLSCKSGGSSKFVAGGEIPIPVASGLGTVSVIYKQYGVVIEFKPTADGQGNIDSGIVVEVSEPDPRNSNQGFVAFTTNRAETQVAIKHNEPLVIAGLLRQAVNRSNDALPGLGRLPLIGALFGAKDNTFDKTELVIVVTPHVVTPQDADNQQAVEKARTDADDINHKDDTRLQENRP
jgi:pilus assembly protein CpaC